MNPLDNERIAQPFTALYETIRSLRDPKTGCPWDLEQDHQTLRPYMLEEAYEAVEVMDGKHPQDLCDELGDVLLQVVLHAQIASENKDFSIADVVQNLNAKLIRRHPHVFGTDEEKTKRGLDQISENWDAIKGKEKDKPKEKGVFEQAKVHKIHPATSQAQKIGKVAAKINFDWDSVQEAWQQWYSEVKELEAEVLCEESQKDAAKIEEELGDVYFGLAQVCRHLGFEPELIAQQGNRKFLKRFAKMESIAVKKGWHLHERSREELNELWIEAKRS